MLVIAAKYMIVPHPTPFHTSAEIMIVRKYSGFSRKEMGS
jgi:hypothetical protein